MSNAEQPGTLSRPWESWVGVGAWVGAACVTAVLIAARYVAAMSQVQPDLYTYFLAAARAMREGSSPYAVEGYFYTPFVAIVLAPLADVPWAQTAWTIAMLAAACGLACFASLACTPRWPSYHRAWLFVIAIVSLLWSWPITMEFFLGQVNLFVGLAIALAAYFASRGRSFSAGMGLGLAAAIKTWPVFLLLWVLRRGARARMRTVLAVALWGAVMVVLALSFGGGSTLATMITSPFRGTNQDVLAYSVWGLGQALFGGIQDFTPLVVSPVARGVVAIVLAIAVVALLVVVLRHPGADVISLYNIVFVVILLMPISHQVYVLLPLPALWWWIAEAARSPKTTLNWVVVAVLTGWWVICFRLAEFGLNERTAVATAVAIVTSTLIAASASTIGAALISRRAQPDADSAGAGISRTGGVA